MCKNKRNIGGINYKNKFDLIQDNIGNKLEKCVNENDESKINEFIIKNKLNVVENIFYKMGWKGKGLGKFEQGILKPLVTKISNKKGESEIINENPHYELDKYIGNSLNTIDSDNLENNSTNNLKISNNKIGIETNKNNFCKELYLKEDI